MSIWLEEIQEELDRRLETEELVVLRKEALDYTNASRETFTVPRRTLLSLIGSYERTHSEGLGSSDYAERLRRILERAIDPVREGRDLAVQEGHRVDEGYFESVFVLLKHAHRQVR